MQFNPLACTYPNTSRWHSQHKYDLTARSRALWLLLLSRIHTRWGLMLTSALSYTKGEKTEIYTYLLIELERKQHRRWRRSGRLPCLSGMNFNKDSPQRFHYALLSNVNIYAGPDILSVLRLYLSYVSHSEPLQLTVASFWKQTVSCFWPRPCFTDPSAL